MRGLLPLLAAGVLAWAPTSGHAPDEAWEGRWAMELRIASVAKIPLIGDQHSLTTSRMLVELRRQGTRWVQRHQLCDAQRQTAIQAVLA